MNEIEIDGHKYAAVESPAPGKCGNCAFKEGFGCKLAERTGNALAHCSGKHRPDGKDVNFVPAHLVQQAQLQSLRQQSGAPLLACKKALRVSDGDFTRAMGYLKTGAWKFGLLIN